MSRTLVRVLSVIILGLLSSSCSADSTVFSGTKVKLASSTFKPDSLNELQLIADQVARTVDKMIPGEPLDYPHDGIVCFEAPLRWNSKEYLAAGFTPPPVTINGPRVFDEPEEVRGRITRIALRGVLGVDPYSKGQLVFELSHELAHVKMGLRTDNYLDETFAVAVSYEALRRLGYQDYLLLAEGLWLHKLPPEPQEALGVQNWAAAQSYWVAKAKAQGTSIDDRPFQTLGALLILRKQNKTLWQVLLNATSTNTCATSATANTFRICEPDIPKMRRQKVLLRRLGLDQTP